jgi:23S rRNA (pseudouridine1915-N3)-methyltransferase
MVSITELQEENYNNVTESLISTIKQKESERILPHLKGYVFAMAIEGKKFSSESLARAIKSTVDGGDGVISFVIGGSYGLSDAVKKRADALISFSDMTFPHTLFRLMLTEQIYRAFCINSGSPYHK